VGTILAAEQMKPETQADYLTKFGIGQPSQVGLPGESAGSLAPGDTWTPLTKATISFGQGVSVNALQMASGIAAIANGGERIAPQLIKGYVAPDGTVTPAPAPARTQVISAAASRQLLDIMEQVTKPDGIAPKGAIAGYRTAGKTGTAQKANSGCHCYKNYTVSFVQIAPARFAPLRRLRRPAERRRTRERRRRRRSRRSPDPQGGAAEVPGPTQRLRRSECRADLVGTQP